MNNFYKRIIYKNGYLLIIAAWFYTLSFVVGNYFNYNNTPLQVKNTLEEYLAGQEKGFENLTGNLDLFTKLANPKADKGNLNLYKSPSGFFIYKMDKDSALEQVFWSRFDMEVFAKELQYRDGHYFVNHTNGYYEYIKKTIRLDSNTFIASCLIPIKNQYFFENAYLKNTFIADESISKYYHISADSGIPVVNSKGKALFNIDKIDKNRSPTMSLWEGILKGIGIFFFFVFLNYFIIEIHEKKGFKTGLALLLISLLFIRLVSYFFPIPFNFRQFELFNPTIFASSTLHPSLGAVIINALLVLWITKFIRYRYDFNSGFFTSEKYNKILSYACLVFFVFAAFYIFSLIRTIVVDSNIPFNVVNFFDLNVYTIAGFFVISVIILIFYNLTYVLLAVTDRTNIPLWIKLALTVGLSVFIIFVLPNTYSIYFRIGVIIWIVGYVSYMHYNIYDLESRLVRSPYFLFWVIFYTFSIAFLMKEDDAFEEAKITNIVEHLSQRSINVDDELLNLSIKELDADLAEETPQRFLDSLDNAFLKDSIFRNNLSGYLNNFDINFFTYDKNGNPLYNKRNTSMRYLDSIVAESVSEVDKKNLYYNESDSVAGTTFIYKNKLVAADTANPVYFYLSLRIKEGTDNNLYVRLLSSGSQFQDLYRSYYIGMYINGKIVNETPQYDFPDTIDVSKLPANKLLTRMHVAGNQYFYKSSENKVFSIIKKEGFVYEFVALFSYLLLFTVLFVLFISLTHFLIEAKFKRKLILQKVQLSFRTQIYTSIIFVSLFSFVIIGAATISFYIINYDKENVVRLSRVIRRFAKEIELDLSNNFRNTNQPPAEQLNNFVIDQVVKLSTVSNENINYYNLQGDIVTTSLPYMYNRKILSDLMNPIAFNEMKVMNKKEFYHKEAIGNLTYLSGYVPVVYNNQRLGFINIPFLNMQTGLQQNIASFITVIVSIIALVFMLAGVLSIFLTQKILESFGVIKDKMRKINLGEENEEIKWNKEDEIGELLDEYNKMLRKLKDSANQLARSEREGAWSEMARQAAHEIKNPLTPMKLNLQFLQKMAASNEEIPAGLTTRIAESLIEQVDQLALIASDFAQFANIGNVRLEKFRLSEVLEKLINMHSINEEIKIVYKKNGDDLVYLDKTQINRLFSNLIKNAVEANEKSENVSIEIVLQNYGDNVVVSVHDYGIGITREQASRIFVPNFTTKSSGTGLGLAISKVIVENAKGKIWFESIPDIGTTFYVSFPLYK